MEQPLADFVKKYGWTPGYYTETLIDEEPSLGDQMSFAKAVIYTARKMAADLDDLGLTNPQRNVVDGYIDMLQAAVIAAGEKTPEGLCNWLEDRHRGLFKVMPGERCLQVKE